MFVTGTTPAESASIGGSSSGLQAHQDITDTPSGLKLQSEGWPALFRNARIKELNLKEPDTDFKE